MTGRLDGRVAIVTGAGGAIGREHARLLAAEGAAVLVNDLGLRDPSAAETVAAEIRDAGGRAVADRGSATWDGAGEIVDHALTEFGRVDILVNNAGATAVGNLWDMTEADWDLTVDVNLKGYFAMIRAIAPHLCQQGSGSIVNTSSSAGYGLPSHSIYATAKEGVIGLTRTVARELGRFGVRCNAIRPSATGAATDEFMERTRPWAELISLTIGPVPGRASRGTNPPVDRSPAKISPFVAWLCSDDAAHVNGRSFHIVGDTISRLSEPGPERSIVREGGWDLDALDRSGARAVTDDLTNPYTLEDHPELRRFG